jgi:hypothetical protein
MSKLRTDMKPVLDKVVANFIAAISYSRTLTVSGPYYPYDDPKGEGNYPSSDLPGCYIFADASGHMKYIGKANRYLGNRIWSHIGRRRRSGESGELYPNAEPWVKENQPNIAVWSVAFQDDHWWLASALEGFLTHVFFPEKNRQI